MTKALIYGLLMVISFSINTAWSAETTDYNRTSVRNKWENTDIPAQKNTEAKTKPEKVTKPRVPNRGLERVKGEAEDVNHNEEIDVLTDGPNREDKKKNYPRSCTSHKDCGDLGQCAKRDGSTKGVCIPIWSETQAPPSDK